MIENNDWYYSERNVREKAAARATSSILLAFLADDRDRHVRLAVARNPRTPGPVLACLASDPDDVVRLAVALHKSTPPDVRARLADQAPRA